MDSETTQRLDALERRIAELERRKLGAPRSARLPGIEGAIGRVRCSYVHYGRKGLFTFHRHRCVYLLRERELVVYVGRSVRGYSTRYSDHADKAHDEVIIADLDISSGVHAEDAWRSLECALIEHYDPPLNTARLPELLEAASFWPTANPDVWRQLVAI
jgi:hypothetical protein